MPRVLFGLAAACLLLQIPSSAQTSGPCDLNGDLAVNIADVQLAANMHLGLAPCTANIDGPGQCTASVVQKVVNAALGSACATTTQRTVRLAWTPSATSGVAGYNLYRRTGVSGAYVKINTSLVTTATYTDNSVQAGQTYYYSARAVNGANVESGDSNIAQAVIPSTS